MVMNVMDPDRVFKGAEFNLLLPMKGRGHGKCRMGGKNTGGLLTVLPNAFRFAARRVRTLLHPSGTETQRHLGRPGAVPAVPLVVLGLWLRENVLWVPAFQANPSLCFHC